MPVDVGEIAVTMVLAMISVGLWTVRVAITARGSRLLGAAAAAVEATVFAVAFSRLLSGLDSPPQIAAYGTGVAVGTVLGLELDTIINPRAVRVDVTDPDLVLEPALEGAGWPRTVSMGHGVTGPVAIISITVGEKRLGEVVDLITATAPTAFWTVTPVRRTHVVGLPPGYIQVASVRRGGSLHRSAVPRPRPADLPRAS